MTVDEITNIIFKGKEKRLVVLNGRNFLLNYIEYLRKGDFFPIHPNARPIDILYMQDYKQYEHKDGDVVFIDMPYYDEDRLDEIDFDFDEFFKWCRKTKYLVYFVNGKLPVPSFPTTWAKGRLPNGDYEETLYANRAI